MQQGERRDEADSLAPEHVEEHDGRQRVSSGPRTDAADARPIGHRRAAEQPRQKARGPGRLGVALLWVMAPSAAASRGSGKGSLRDLCNLDAGAVTIL